MIVNGVIDWKEGAPKQIKPGMFLSIHGGMYLVGDVLPKFQSVERDIAAHGILIPMHTLKWIEAMQAAHNKGFITRLRRPEEEGDDTIPFDNILSGTGAMLAPNAPATPMNISDEITSFLLNSEYQYVDEPNSRYRIIALSKAAGELKGSKFIITYQNTETGKVHSRSEADFFERMINVPPKVYEPAAAVPSEKKCCGGKKCGGEQPTDGMSEIARRANIATMASRFLSWPLPKTVQADPCACDPTAAHRTGTNLLTYEEAMKMFEHVTEGLE